MGPNTVSRLSTTASGPPTARSRGTGLVTVVVMGGTLPSFHGSLRCRAGTSEETPPRARLAGPPLPGSGRPPLRRCGRRSVDVVDNRTEVREFLTTRRAKITPDQAGVPLYGQRR